MAEEGEELGEAVTTLQAAKLTHQDQPLMREEVVAHAAEGEVVKEEAIEVGMLAEEIQEAEEDK